MLPSTVAAEVSLTICRDGTAVVDFSLNDCKYYGLRMLNCVGNIPCRIG